MASITSFQHLCSNLGSNPFYSDPRNPNPFFVGETKAQQNHGEEIQGLLEAAVGHIINKVDKDFNKIVGVLALVSAVAFTLFGMHYAFNFGGFATPFSEAMLGIGGIAAISSLGVYARKRHLLKSLKQKLNPDFSNLKGDELQDKIIETTMTFGLLFAHRRKILYKEV